MCGDRGVYVWRVRSQPDPEDVEPGTSTVLATAKEVPSAERSSRVTAAWKELLSSRRQYGTGRLDLIQNANKRPKTNAEFDDENKENEKEEEEVKKAGDDEGQ